jgi:hypothetical protein
MEVKLHTFLSLAADGNEMSASFFCYLGSGERVLGAHAVWGWADLKANLCVVQDQNQTLPLLEYKPKLRGDNFIGCPSASTKYKQNWEMAVRHLRFLYKKVSFYFRYSKH